VDDPVRGAGRDALHVEIDLHGSGANRVNVVTAALARSEVERTCGPQPIARVVDLGKTALAVELPETDDPPIGWSNRPPRRRNRP
jgi:hypothetical protein